MGAPPAGRARAMLPCSTHVDDPLLRNRSAGSRREQSWEPSRTGRGGGRRCKRGGPWKTRARLSAGGRVDPPLLPQWLVGRSCGRYHCLRDAPRLPSRPRGAQRPAPSLFPAETVPERGAVQRSYMRPPSPPLSRRHRGSPVTSERQGERCALAGLHQRFSRRPDKFASTPSLPLPPFASHFRSGSRSYELSSTLSDPPGWFPLLEQLGLDPWPMVVSRALLPSSRCLRCSLLARASIPSSIGTLEREKHMRPPISVFFPSRSSQYTWPNAAARPGSTLARFGLTYLSSQARAAHRATLGAQARPP